MGHLVELNRKARRFAGDFKEQLRALYLNSLPDRPWRDWNRGRGITPAAVAKVLVGFVIQPKSIRLGDERIKGYLAADFKDAFHRYQPKGLKLA
jgi:hypothetical protein